MVSSFIIPVANFDFNVDGFVEDIFSFSVDENKRFPFSFELIGYGHNSILNMGSIFFVNSY